MILTMPAALDVKTSVSIKTSAPPKLPEKVERAMATIEDDDERLLAEIGYEQVRVLLLNLLKP